MIIFGSPSRTRASASGPKISGGLFVEFQQLDEGAAKEYAGAGLGLALTKRIVEARDTPPA